MKFHITITNNVTGDVLVDQDTSAIIGSCDCPGDSTRCLTFTSCDDIELLATITGALEVVEIQLKKLPKKLQSFVRKLAKKEALSK